MRSHQDWHTTSISLLAFGCSLTTPPLWHSADTQLSHLQLIFNCSRRISLDLIANEKYKSDCDTGYNNFLIVCWRIGRITRYWSNYQNQLLHSEFVCGGSWIINLLALVNLLFDFLLMNLSPSPDPHSLLLSINSIYMRRTDLLQDLNQCSGIHSWSKSWIIQLWSCDTLVVC